MPVDNNNQPAQQQAPKPAADNFLLMVTMAHTMALQSATAGIPVFDGRNIPLKDSIQDVRNAASDITDDQLKLFLKKVLGKLRGSARNCSYGFGFNTVDELVKHLKRRFAPGKIFSYYNAQLNELRMMKDDTVGDFRDKPNILLMRAESSLPEEKGNDYEDSMMVPMQETAIHIFIRGLPAHINSAVDLFHPRILDEAYEEAVRIESRIRSRILPDSRGYVEYGSRFNESNEMSHDIRPMSKPGYGNFSGFANNTHPAYVGYVEESHHEASPTSQECFSQ